MAQLSTLYDTIYDTILRTIWGPDVHPIFDEDDIIKDTTSDGK